MRRILGIRPRDHGPHVGESVDVDDEAALDSALTRATEAERRLRLLEHRVHIATMRRPRASR